MRWVILDTETTGLEPRQGHRLVEIGVVEIINRRRANHWHEYLNPKRESDPGALEKHGLSTEFLADKPQFSAVVDSLLDFLRGADLLVIHNASFDIGFLDHELNLLGRERLLASLSGTTLVDSLKVARESYPGKRNSLDALCERFGVDNSHRVHHGALLDAELLGEVYLALTRGQDSLDMPEEDSLLGHGEMYGYSVVPRVLRVVRATPEEEMHHEANLVQIDQACGGQSQWHAEEVPLTL
ncbi:MAG: DNA polymerase III subunit epsilon [Ferrovum sp.]|nr:DNA polymerase III subunit epsilon [Ferrovum sp.]NDU88113.1 DNA polymerase III subunit epsilon [Ferrovum sp.]